MSSNEPVIVAEHGSSTTLLAGVLLLVTFIAGAVIGVVADRIFLMARARSSGRTAQVIVERLDRKLDLDDSQRAQVTEIVRRHQAKIASIWTDVRPHVRQELEAANAEIEQILTPEQRAKFEKMKLRLPPPRRGGGGLQRHE